MKTAFSKTIITLMSLALVALLVMVAALIGVRAVAVSQGIADDLLLVALAFGVAFVGIAKSFKRSAGEDDGDGEFRLAVNSRRAPSRCDHGFLRRTTLRSSELVRQ